VPLNPGSRLGPYEVVGSLGAGGMGEVYRARDTRLDRSIAIKILPPQMAADAEFRERFDREARSIGALNHPHICTLHDVGHHEGTDFLVMELVEGETLAERLQQGPLPLREALDIAQQIADALEAAHEKGILHRDLKPANIKVTPDGSVKVLDFGLAKVLDGSPAGTQLANSPTLSRLATQAGLIMGTAAYMSPEQARGKPVDRRTDVWAFGCVLYEMLTAKPAFDGETITDILGAIVHKEPDWSALPSDAPARLRELLQRCLQKDPKQRLRDMGDARLEIDVAHRAPVIESAAVAAAPAWRSWWRAALPWAIAGTSIIALAVATTAWWRVASQPRRVTRVNVEISPKAPLAPLWGQAAILSPDGSTIAYIAAADGQRRLYLRRLDQLESSVLPGTEGATTPFFSPDGRSVGFFASGSLKKVALSGGAPIVLCSPGEGRGGTWGEDDTIVFSATPASDLFRMSAAGGTPVAITTRDQQNEQSHRWPQFLPGTNKVLFTAMRAPSSRRDEANIEVVDLATAQRKVVHRGGTYARFAASGHLLFVRESTLFAMPFDVGRLEVTGEAVPVLEGVAAQSSAGGSGIALYDVSSTGTMAFLTGDLSEGMSLVAVDLKGAFTPLRSERAVYMAPRFSPDGERIAMHIANLGAPDVWVFDVARGSLSRLTFGPGPDGFPIWTPDGERVTYESGSPPNLFWMRADGSGQPERLTNSPNAQRAGSWSPDGKVLAFSEMGAGNVQGDLWIMRMDGERTPQPFLQTPAVEAAPEFSPDGRWIAYHSNETGRMEVFVRPFSGSGKWQVSTQGGVFPKWSRNSQELAYRITSDRMMVVSYTSTERSFQPATPRALFRDEFAVRTLTPMYDLAPDGKRFVMMHEGDNALSSATHLTLIFNWFEELKSRVPSP
jgi:eukaryotic-like serine/threonine-protein kinase